MRVRAGNLLGLVVLGALLGTPVAHADEQQIVTAIDGFFATEDLDEREVLVRRIESDAAYERGRVTEWLHRAVGFDLLDGGIQHIQVRFGKGQTRSVALRIPADYDARKPWPLIYALHGSGGHGEDIIGYVERVLGDAADEYVIAAPSGYGEVVVHSEWPPAMEHPAALAAIKRTVHVDSDRVFVMGYSRGGHAAWTLAVLHADEFAGAVPLAGTFALPEVDGLWETFLPNLAHTPVLCVWGAEDVYADGRKEPSRDGGIAGLNRRLCELAGQMQVPVVGRELPGKGHGGIVPPAEPLHKLLSGRRVHYPREVHHTFRDIYQSRAYWLEGHAWSGPQWAEGLPKIRLREGEDANNPKHVKAALLRTFRASLGELRGRVDGQAIDVRRKKVQELTIWFGEGLIDWEQPVVVQVSGRKVFEGRLEPDLFVCLSQAARTYDFDRLRWAGLRFKSGSKTCVVTGRTEFPVARNGP